MFGKALKVLGSWWVTAAILLMLSGIYISFTFGDNPYAGWANFLAHSRSGVCLQICFILNLLFASLRILFFRLKPSPVSPEDVRAMDVYMELPLSAGHNLQSVFEWTKVHGFTGEISADAINFRKGKLSVLPGTLVRGGLLIFLTALLFSSHLRTTSEIPLHAGETVSSPGGAVTLESIDSHIPEEFFQVGEEGTFSLDGVSAVLRASGESHRISAGLPVRIMDRYFRISDLGYSYQVGLEEPGQRIEKQLDLNILPPGRTDIVAFPPQDLLLTFTMQPGKTITKGLLTGRQFSLIRPVYRIILQKGKDKDKSEPLTLRPGESGRAGGFSVSLGKTSLFIKLQSVYDPALRWIYAGFLLFLAGLVFMTSRFFWYEKQLSAVVCGDVLLIGYREEFFRKWGIQKFSLWTEELAGEEESSAALRINP